MALDLSLFSASGTVHMAMRITAGNFERGNGQENIWAGTNWTADGSAGQVGTIEEGDADITADVTLARFARWDSGDRLILNSVGNISNLFDQAGDAYRLSFVRETSTGHEIITVGPPSGESADRTFADWRVSDGTLTASEWNQLNAISASDEIILAVHEGTAIYQYRDATGTLDGGLAGSLSGDASLFTPPTTLDAVGGLSGGLAGSLAGVASLLSPTPLDAAGTLAGGLAGSVSGAASIASMAALNAVGGLSGGLAGSLSGAASLSPLPLDAAGTLTGGLAGSLSGVAGLHTPPAPETYLERWIRTLRLPWDELPRRWALTLAIGHVLQGVLDTAGVALREWWPATCRPETLAVWGQILGRPQYAGETAEAYRRRLTLWRSEAVGTSKWVRDEVARITGSRRVIEFPLDGMRVGYGPPIGEARIGVGPSVTVGVAGNYLEAVREVLESGIPPHVGVNYLDEDTFDAI